MVHKIVVVSRKDLSESVDSLFGIPKIEGDWALISIYRDLEVLRTIKRLENIKSLGCIDHISLRFSDVEKGDHIKDSDLIPFNKEHAKKIISFIDKNKDKVQTLVTQCAAGISRSGAVGLFACRYLGLDEIVFRKENIISPNMLVLSTLNEVSGLNRDYVKFWEDLRKERETKDSGIVFI